MKRNRLLEIVLANTSPITEEEFDAFLLRRHGAISRENFSADSSMLDAGELERLEELPKRKQILSKAKKAAA